MKFLEKFDKLMRILSPLALVIIAILLMLNMDKINNWAEDKATEAHNKRVEDGAREYMTENGVSQDTQDAVIDYAKQEADTRETNTNQYSKPKSNIPYYYNDLVEGWYVPDYHPVWGGKSKTDYYAFKNWAIQTNNAQFYNDIIPVIETQYINGTTYSVTDIINGLISTGKYTFYSSEYEDIGRWYDADDGVLISVYPIGMYGNAENRFFSDTFRILLVTKTVPGPNMVYDITEFYFFDPSHEIGISMEDSMTMLDEIVFN